MLCLFFGTSCGSFAAGGSVIRTPNKATAGASFLVIASGADHVTDAVRSARLATQRPHIVVNPLWLFDSLSSHSIQKPQLPTYLVDIIV
jgi:hypothetical protein